MKKKFLTILVCAVTSMFLTGCNAVEKAMKFREGETVFDSYSRFVYTSNYTVNDNFFIIRDKETGVLYIMMINGTITGLCPLYDSDGNIVVEKEPDE